MVMTSSTADYYFRIFVIGNGVTGKSTAYTLRILRENCIDINNKDSIEPADYYIICLPTPTINGRQDISAIEEWMSKLKKLNKDALVILRSTVLPGTTNKLIKKYGMKIVFVPEFLTESSALYDSQNPEFMVIGSSDILARNAVYSIFKPYVNTKLWITCNSTTAETIKYAMNSFFALKVIYANQLWDLCVKAGADYGKIREALETHKWGSKNGWDVWHNCKRGYSGKCLPKDVEALVNFADLPLLETMDKINKELLKNKK